MQVFQQAQGREQGNMQHILQASISSLDEEFLADPHIPSLVCMPCNDWHIMFYDKKLWMWLSSLLKSVLKLRCQLCTEAMVCAQDRACSAASGVIVYLDFKAEKVWAGQVGTTRQLVLGQLFHGLAVQRTAAVVLNDASRCTTTTLWYTTLCYGRCSCAQLQSIPNMRSWS